MHSELQDLLLSMGFPIGIIQQVKKMTSETDKAVELAMELNKNGHQCKEIKNQNDFQYEDQEYKMVFLVRKDLKLKLNSIAEEVATAALLAYKWMQHQIQHDEDCQLALDGWVETGSKKIVVKVNDERQLMQTIQKSKDRKVPAQIIRSQNSKYQFPNDTIILGVLGPASVDLLDQFTKQFKLL